MNDKRVVGVLSIFSESQQKREKASIFAMKRGLTGFWKMAVGWRERMWCQLMKKREKGRMMLNFLVWGLQLMEVLLIEKEDTTRKITSRVGVGIR